MIEELSDSDIRSRCKGMIESLELWLRRLIDQTLTAEYGDYFSHQDDAGNRLLSKQLAASIENRLRNEPERYSRRGDAILLDDAIKIVCNQKLYAHFRPALQKAFPEGNSECRTFLGRLIDSRNRLAHANPISLKDALRVLCYCNDVIDSISDYYVSENMNQEYNVPLIQRFTDSFGNTVHRDQMLCSRDGGGCTHNFHQTDKNDLRPGATLTVEVFIDPAFDPATYAISWSSVPAFSSPAPNSSKVIIPIGLEHVCTEFVLLCYLKTTNAWHRLNNDCDDMLVLRYRVLPPI